MYVTAAGKDNYKTSSCPDERMTAPALPKLTRICLSRFACRGRSASNLEFNSTVRNDRCGPSSMLSAHAHGRAHTEALAAVYLHSRPEEEQNKCTGVCTSRVNTCGGRSAALDSLSYLPARHAVNPAGRTCARAARRFSLSSKRKRRHCSANSRLSQNNACGKERQRRQMRTRYLLAPRTDFIGNMTPMRG